VITHPVRTIGEQIHSGQRFQGSELSITDLHNVLDDTMGRVLFADIGKKVWLKSYGIVMENREQRNRRKGVEL